MRFFVSRRKQATAETLKAVERKDIKPRRSMVKSKKRFPVLEHRKRSRVNLSLPVFRKPSRTSSDSQSPVYTHNRPDFIPSSHAPGPCACIIPSSQIKMRSQQAAGAMPALALVRPAVSPSPVRSYPHRLSRVTAPPCAYPRSHCTHAQATAKAVPKKAACAIIVRSSRIIRPPT